MTRWWSIPGAALIALSPLADAQFTPRAFAHPLRGVEEERAAAKSGKAMRSPRAGREKTAVVPWWPVQGTVTSTFGPRRALFGRGTHSGVDIAARPGTAIRVPAAGKVVFAGWRNGYGRTIVIDHGRDVHTLYAHLSRVHVRPGRNVDRGTVIGLTGATGLVSGPHLHYEVLVRGRPVHPRRFARLVQSAESRVIAQSVRAR